MCMIVRLLVPFRSHAAGDVIILSLNTALYLLDEGMAVAAPVSLTNNPEGTRT
jgi:hypothetical protein